MGPMIRTAEASDRRACVHLMQEFHEELGRGLFPPELSYGYTLFDRFLTQPNHAAFVYEADGKAQGLLFAQWGWHDLGPLKVATERLWFVTKPYRGRAWRPMLSAFEAWARAQGCEAVAMVALSGNDAGKLYARQGYSPVETHFLKRL